MKFRPCIDLHNGVVKQIVGSTLSDEAAVEDQSRVLVENFIASKPAAEFAAMYRDDGLVGGHVIMLGPNNEEAAMSALREYPMGLQIGGGINSSNAISYLEAGAAQVIVTSYVFLDGRIQFDRLEELVQLVGRDRLVLDLSCRRKVDAFDGLYYVVTNKWTKFTDFPLTPENVRRLSEYCVEFLVHAVDVEGKQNGIEEDLVALLGEYCPIPVTYAGGVRSIDVIKNWERNNDLELVERIGKGKVDVTVGSALDIFGGSLSYSEVVKWHNIRSEK